MPLMLRPAEPSDLPRIVQLENASFADSPLTPILFPNGQPPDAQDAYVESLRKKWTTDTASRHMVVVDTNLDDKIIAFARWSIYVGDDVRFIKTDLSQKEPTPGSNVEAHNEYFGGLLKFRVDLLGKKEYCCKSD